MARRVEYSYKKVSFYKIHLYIVSWPACADFLTFKNLSDGKYSSLAFLFPQIFQHPVKPAEPAGFLWEVFGLWLGGGRGGYLEH